MVNIFEYINYQDFLNAFYTAKKSENPQFSYRSFAKKAGLKSPNYLKLVIDGKRSITGALINSFIKGLGLDSKETAYFTAMVEYTNCREMSVKSDLLEALLTHKYSLQYYDLKGFKADRLAFDVIRDPDYFIIYELINVKGFKKTVQWVNKRLKNPIEGFKFHKVIRDMLRGGFLQKNSSGGLKHTEVPMKFHVSEIKRMALVQHHLEMIKRGSMLLQDEENADNHFPSVTLAVDEETLAKVKDDINKFLHQITVKYRKPKGADQVLQLTMQLFEHTK